MRQSEIFDCLMVTFYRQRETMLMLFFSRLFVCFGVLYSEIAS